MTYGTLWKRVVAPVVALGALGAPAAFAATIGFDGPKADPYLEDGFVATGARVVGGNCGPSGKPCLALNDNDTTTITASDGGTFSAASFWFELLGRARNNTLTVTSSAGETLNLSAAEYGRNDGGQVINLADLGFEDIVSLTFTKSGGGNARVDDLVVEGGIAPVPLPASGALLLLPFAALAGLRRRRKA